MNDADPKNGEQDVCFNCGGRVQLVVGPDRLFTHQRAQYLVPADLALLTCDDCGERLLTPDDARALAHAVEAQLVAPARATG